MGLRAHSDVLSYPCENKDTMSIKTMSKTNLNGNEMDKMKDYSKQTITMSF